MRGALFRNLSLYARNRHFSLYVRSAPVVCSVYDNLHHKIHTGNAPRHNYFPSRIRFFSSENGNQDPDSAPQSESGVEVTDEKNAAVVSEIEDVENKELKTQIEDYLENLNEEALPVVFESVLKRKLSEKHEETDNELMDELELQPLENVTNEDFESDFEDANETDDEVEELYNAKELVIKRKESDPYFNMTDTKWNEMIKESTKLGYLPDTRECEEILEDMIHWNKLLPDDVKKKVEEKFNEIADRMEKGELNDEEGYALFKVFEDQIVKECASKKSKQPTRKGGELTNRNMEADGEGPILRWQTRVVMSHGGDSWHPKNRLVKLSVTVKELGLDRYQFMRLRELVGKRYNPGKDELTITSERFEHREENRKDCLRTLYALLEEARKAKEMVHEIRVADIKSRLKANPAFMQKLQSKKKASIPDPVMES